MLSHSQIKLLFPRGMQSISPLSHPTPWPACKSTYLAAHLFSPSAFAPKLFPVNDLKNGVGVGNTHFPLWMDFFLPGNGVGWIPHYHECSRNAACLSNLKWLQVFSTPQHIWQRKEMSPMETWWAAPSQRVRTSPSHLKILCQWSFPQAGIPCRGKSSSYAVD